MNIPEKNEIDQLAETFLTACKRVVEEGKIATYTAPVVTAALAALTTGVTTKSYWG